MIRYGIIYIYKWSITKKEVRVTRKLVASALAVLTLSTASFSIDWELAKRYNQIFSQLNHETIVKSPCRVTPQQVVEMIKNKENIVLLDIRTEAEQSIVGPTYKNTLYIPMDKLFTEENLKKLPRDKKIIVVCGSGTRAAVTTFALRSLGFDNVYALDGGMSGLTQYVSPKTTLGVK